MLWIPITSGVLLVLFLAELGWPGLAVWACTLPLVCMALAPVAAEDDETTGGLGQ